MTLVVGAGDYPVSFGAVGAFLVLPGIDLLVGGTIALVTLVGRNGHRNRLLRQRSGMP